MESHDDIVTLNEPNILSSSITFDFMSQIIANDTNTMCVNMIIQSLPKLTIQHLELIDWTSIDPSQDVHIFQSDYALACYLNVVEPMKTSISEPSISMTESDIKYLSQKNKSWTLIL